MQHLPISMGRMLVHGRWCQFMNPSDHASNMSFNYIPKWARGPKTTPTHQNRRLLSILAITHNNGTLSIISVAWLMHPLYCLSLHTNDYYNLFYGINTRQQHRGCPLWPERPIRDAWHLFPLEEAHIVSSINIPPPTTTTNTHLRLRNAI